jgi:hypothetical protein
VEDSLINQNHPQKSKVGSEYWIFAVNDQGKGRVDASWHLTGKYTAEYCHVALLTTAAKTKQRTRAIAEQK